MKLKICEVVLYQERFEKIDTIVDVCNLYKRIKDYAVILHDKEDVKPHYHLMLRFTDSFDTDKLLEWFDCRDNQIEKIKGRFADALAYLTHSNSPDKYQYALEEVKSNFDFNKESKTLAKKKELERLLLAVADGEIKPYQFGEKIEDIMYIKNDRKFEIAYEKYLKKQYNTISRNINVIFITGGTGLGKTTLGKKWCEDKNKSYVLSSSDNDVMQDYRGQDVLILDDLRDSSFKFNDLLKLLDNHINSSVTSRYKNKVFVGDTIIVTSSVGIFDWYNGMISRGMFDDVKQLYRRISLYIRLHGNLMTLSTIDYDKFELKNSHTMRNPIMDMMFETKKSVDMYDSFIDFANSENERNEEMRREIYNELWGEDNITYID